MKIDIIFIPNREQKNGLNSSDRDDLIMDIFFNILFYCFILVAGSQVLSVIHNYGNGVHPFQWDHAVNQGGGNI